MRTYYSTESNIEVFTLDQVPTPSTVFIHKYPLKTFIKIEKIYLLFIF